MEGADRWLRNRPSRQIIRGLLDDEHKRIKHVMKDPRTCQEDCVWRSSGQRPMLRTCRHGREDKHNGKASTQDSSTLRSGGAPIHEERVEGVRHVLGKQCTTYSTCPSSKTLCGNEQALVLGEEEYPSAAQCRQGEERRMNFGARTAQYVDDDDWDSSQAWHEEERNEQTHQQALTKIQECGARTNRTVGTPARTAGVLVTSTTFTGKVRTSKSAKCWSGPEYQHRSWRARRQGGLWRRHDDERRPENHVLARVTRVETPRVSRAWWTRAEKRLLIMDMRTVRQTGDGARSVLSGPLGESAGSVFSGSASTQQAPVDANGSQRIRSSWQGGGSDHGLDQSVSCGGFTWSKQQAIQGKSSREGGGCFVDLYRWLDG